MIAEEYQKQSPEVFYKKIVLKSFAELTGKHFRWSSWATASQTLKLLFVPFLQKKGKQRFEKKHGSQFAITLIKQLPFYV